MPGGQTSLNLMLKDLEPWQPDIDERRTEKPQIMTGTNFRDDVDGPRSYFASNLNDFNYWDATSRNKIVPLNIGSSTLYGTGTGVWKINPTTGLAEILLAITTVNKYWPWTIALVGGLYYIAQYDIGLWQYDPVNETLAHILTPVGDSVRFVAASYGRLVYLGPTTVAISALDDGTDLVPDLASAASAQPLAMVGGTAFHIEPIDDGFLVFQQNGIMKAAFTQQAWVFNYDKLTAGKDAIVKIFSPNAACYIPRVGVVSLDETGFNLTRENNYQDGGKPQAWEILMGDYIQKNIVNLLNKNLYGTVNLYYCPHMQLLFVTFSSSTVEGVMNIGFVWSPINKRWSSFDHQNTGIIELFDPTTNTFMCGYVALDGYFRAFEEQDFSQDLPADPTSVWDYIYRPLETDELVRLTVDTAGVITEKLFTIINFSDNNPAWYSNYTNSGLYYINFTPYSDTMNDSADDPPDVIGPIISIGTYINFDTSGVVELFALPYTLDHIGLNSTLQIGPFRFSDQAKSSETSLVDTVMIGGSVVSGFIETEDWLEDAGSEDWLSDSGAEDWGSGTASPNSYDITLRDTNDGYNPPLQGDETMFVFLNLGAALVFRPIGYSSIYHTLQLSCTEPGQSFAVKTLDLEGMLTGLLQSS